MFGSNIDSIQAETAYRQERIARDIRATSHGARRRRAERQPGARRRWRLRPRPAA